MVTHHPGVGGSLYWTTCFHELVPEPDVRLSIASGSPTSPYTLLYMAEIGRLCRSAGWADHDSVVGVLAVRGWHPQSAEIYIIGVKAVGWGSSTCFTMRALYRTRAALLKRGHKSQMLFIACVQRNKNGAFFNDGSLSHTASLRQ